MKRILLFTILAATLGGCAVVPYGYGDHRDGNYYRDRGYSRDAPYRDPYYGQRDGYYRDRSYQGGWNTQSDPFRDHGG